MKALACLLLWACTASVEAKPPCCSTNRIELGTPSDQSLFQVQTDWISDFGKPMKLERLQGRVQIVTLFFTTCEFACPLLVNDLRKIEAALPEAVRGEVVFVLVSFDSARDTVEVLHAYRKRLNLDEDRWVVLRGEADDVMELSALLGVKFKKDQRGQFAHSNAITILNPAGEIIHQQIGLNQDPAATVKAVEKALK